MAVGVGFGVQKWITKGGNPKAGRRQCLLATGEECLLNRKPLLPPAEKNGYR